MRINLPQALALLAPFVALFACGPIDSVRAQDPTYQAVIQAQQERLSVIERAAPTVVAIYDSGRQGGGSGVLVSADGLVLTNHHVVMGAGVEGFGGLNDGRLYHWHLIGTDPGGDLAIIQLEGRDDFPFSPIGDSSLVRVGDFAMAMGNPFLLAEDQTPTITLGVVSGVQRYQYGAGQNELVYGNCIQVDSSINPGNSGGPLFNMRAEVIGINGRGSFASRGRVNVGLGYAISSDQVKNFLPDLLATKLTEHGSLDAQFGDRDGGVICERLNLDSAAARAGLELGDRLVKFQGFPVQSANQFTNLISTMPEGWPVNLEVIDSKGNNKSVWLRLLGLPYKTPDEPQIPEDAPPEQRQAMEKQLRMIRFLRSTPGEPTNVEINRHFARQIFARMRQSVIGASPLESPAWDYRWAADGNRALAITRQETGTWSVELSAAEGTSQTTWNGSEYQLLVDGQTQTLRKAAARARPEVFLADFLQMLATGLDDSTLIELHGADWSGGSVCHRLKLTESDGEWFFVWVRAFDDAIGSAGELVKISTDIDSDPAAILFGLSGNPLEAFELVKGLGEEPLASWTVSGEADSILASRATGSPVTPIDPVQVNPIFDAAVRAAWLRTVKIYGASAGNVEGYGTGILVSDDGLILTGTGVHLTGRTIRVQIPNRGIVNATLVKQDRSLQLALLKADIAEVPYFDLSRPSSAERGDWALLVTNAFKVAEGEEPLSVSLGVVSLPTELVAMRNRRDVAFDGNLVLIDAITSNPGAAGGAVIDAAGELIGMSGRVIESGDTNTRLNYAVPTISLDRFVRGNDEAVATTEDPSEATGVPGELGIRLLRLGLSGSRDPAYIDRVVPGSAAAEAGLRSDDLIVSINGEKVNSIADYNDRLKTIFAGVETVVLVKRGDELLRVILIPAEK